MQKKTKAGARVKTHRQRGCNEKERGGKTEKVSAGTNERKNPFKSGMQHKKTKKRQRGVGSAGMSRRRGG